MSKGEQIMAGFWDLFNKRTWLDGIKMKESLQGYHPSEIHCIAQIGNHAEANVSKLAESFAMTRSAISKLTKKLIAKELIESYQKPENKKEVYFRLTAKGQTVYQIHERLHREYQARDKAVLDQVSEEQLAMMMSFVEAYQAHLDAEIAKLGPDSQAAIIDRL